jgi:hypothetical protein
MAKNLSVKLRDDQEADLVPEKDHPIISFKKMMVRRKAPYLNFKRKKKRSPILTL